jgi:hypothetical protein
MVGQIRWTHVAKPTRQGRYSVSFMKLFYLAPGVDRVEFDGAKQYF